MIAAPCMEQPPRSSEKIHDGLLQILKLQIRYFVAPIPFGMAPPAPTMKLYNIPSSPIPLLALAPLLSQHPMPSQHRAYRESRGCHAVAVNPTSDPHRPYPGFTANPATLLSYPAVPHLLSPRAPDRCRAALSSPSPSIKRPTPPPLPFPSPVCLLRR